MYHAQIQIGNIIPNIDKAWSEIGYFQIGDTPGRNEPLTGEMNYKKILNWIECQLDILICFSRTCVFINHDQI